MIHKPSLQFVWRIIVS